MIGSQSFYRSIIVLALFLVFSGCQENTSINCNDCNALVCLVNGREFTTHSNDWKSSALNATSYNDKDLEINAYGGGEYVGLFLHTSDTIRVGTYQLNSTVAGTGLYSDGFKHDYTTNTTNTGELTITRFDYGVRPYMEGTFHYQCVNDFTKENISISKGAFKVFLRRN